MRACAQAGTRCLNVSRHPKIASAAQAIPELMTASGRCFNVQLKSFWSGEDGWHERQWKFRESLLGTVEGMQPLGECYLHFILLSIATVSVSCL